jgi:hypothetical protein
VAQLKQSGISPNPNARSSFDHIIEQFTCSNFKIVAEVESIPRPLFRD